MKFSIQYLNSFSPIKQKKGNQFVFCLLKLDSSNLVPDKYVLTKWWFYFGFLKLWRRYAIPYDLYFFFKSKSIPNDRIGEPVLGLFVAGYRCKKYHNLVLFWRKLNSSKVPANLFIYMSQTRGIISLLTPQLNLDTVYINQTYNFMLKCLSIYRKRWAENWSQHILENHE